MKSKNIFCFLLLILVFSGSCSKDTVFNLQDSEIRVTKTTSSSIFIEWKQPNSITAKKGFEYMVCISGDQDIFSGNELKDILRSYSPPVDWTPDISSAILLDLSSDKEYYIAVYVKAAGSGKTFMYPVIQVRTSAESTHAADSLKKEESSENLADKALAMVLVEE